MPSQAQKPMCEFAFSGSGEKKCRKCHAAPGNPTAAGATGHCSHNGNVARLGPQQPHTQHWRKRHDCILLLEYEGQGAFALQTPSWESWAA